MPSALHQIGYVTDSPLPTHRARSVFPLKPSFRARGNSRASRNRRGLNYTEWNFLVGVNAEQIASKLMGDRIESPFVGPSIREVDGTGQWSKGDGV